MYLPHAKIMCLSHFPPRSWILGCKASSIVLWKARRSLLAEKQTLASLKQRFACFVVQLVKLAHVSSLPPGCKLKQTQAYSNQPDKTRTKGSDSAKRTRWLRDLKSSHQYMYTCIYILSIHIYIYICRERERENYLHTMYIYIYL